MRIENLEQRKVAGLEELYEYRRSFERLKRTEPTNVRYFEALARMVELNDVYTNIHWRFMAGSGKEHIQVTQEDLDDYEVHQTIVGDSLNGEYMQYVDELIADIYHYIREIENETA